MTPVAAAKAPAAHRVLVADLKLLIDRVLCAACKDETRFHLNGARLELAGDNLRAISTDGHRLHMAEMPWSGGAVDAMIVPRRGLEMALFAIKESHGSAEIEIKGNRFTVSTGDASISIRGIDAQFPPYDRVIPKSHKTTITVDRSKLRTALRKVPRNADGGVALEANSNGLYIMGPGSGDTDVQLVKVTVEGKLETRIGANPVYLEEALAEMPKGDLTIELGNALDPIVLKGSDGFLAVIMPMRT